MRVQIGESPYPNGLAHDVAVTPRYIVLPLPPVKLDFAAIARGMGCHGVRVDRIDDFESALGALAQGGVTLVEGRVEADYDGEHRGSGYPTTCTTCHDPRGVDHRARLEQLATPAGNATVFLGGSYGSAPANIRQFIDQFETGVLTTPFESDLYFGKLSWQPASSLHPSIGVHTPLIIDASSDAR